ncbi:MAG: group II intron maturase-specific domain-containing protein [Marinifilaceae bacterium]
MVTVFVRYADDFSIYVRSQRAGARAKESISRYMAEQLKLRVNEEKSVVCLCFKTIFLGYSISLKGELLIADKSIKHLKEKVREVTKRNRGRSFASIIIELNPILRGWFQYFKFAKCSKHLRILDSWISRKLQCYRLKQCKRVITLKRFLCSLGVKSY